jgi:aconitate hydratase
MLGLSGEETFDVQGVSIAVMSGGPVHVTAVSPKGKKVEFEVKARIDTPQEAEYYRHGGILPYVLRQLMTTEKSPAVVA